MSVTDEHETSEKVTPLDRVLSEYLARIDRGETVDREAFMASHPEHRDGLREFFEDHGFMSALAAARIATPATLADDGPRRETRQGTTRSGQSAPVSDGPGDAFSGPFPAPFGRYRVLGLLGRGGMAEVYLADDPALGRKVAIKTPRKSIRETPEQLARLMREARACAALRHQTICPVYEVGTADGLPYIAMAHIEGRTLADWAAAEAIPPHRVALVVRRIALALETAHRAGIVHRDLKPSNILIDAEGEPVVMDFGLAAVSESGASSSLTVEGMILGTPAYMSPEQVRCEWDRVGPASDIYSLGVILYELLAGRRPFEGALMAVLIETASEHVLPKPIAELCPEIDPRLQAVCSRMLAKRAEDRYANMREVAAALDLYLDGGQRTAPETHRPTVVLSQSAAPSGDIPRDHRRAAPWTGWLWGAGGLFLAGMIVILIQNRDGSTTRIEVPDGTVVRIEKTDEPEQPESPVPRSSTLAPRPTPAAAPWNGWPAESPRPAIAPFDAAQARRHQEEWAKHHNVPIEFTNSIGLTFRLIPPGEFLMGATEHEIQQTLAQRPTDIEPVKAIVRSSGPQHRVVLTRAFYLMTCELTQADYERVMNARPSRFAATGQIGDLVAKVRGLDTSRFPVEMVSWVDAAEFCVRLSALENRSPAYELADGAAGHLDSPDGYRLPTEAEWEFACRAGTTGMFPWSDVEQGLSRTTWWDGNSGGRSHPVASLEPNPFGLHDMHGNVREWCQDAFNRAEYALRTDGPRIDPIGANGGPLRVSRGGAWNIDAPRTQSPRRSSDEADVRRDDTGIRLLLPVGASPPASPDEQSSSAP